MMINTHHTIAAGLLALSTLTCPPEAPQAPEAPQPTPNFDCSMDVVLLPSIDFELHCDMNPPQILAAILDDAPDDWAACADAGGRVLYDGTIDRFYCINMDY